MQDDGQRKQRTSSKQTGEATKDKEDRSNEVDMQEGGTAGMWGLAHGGEVEIIASLLHLHLKTASIAGLMNEWKRLSTHQRLHVNLSSVCQCLLVAPHPTERASIPSTGGAPSPGRRPVTWAPGLPLYPSLPLLPVRALVPCCPSLGVLSLRRTKYSLSGPGTDLISSPSPLHGWRGLRKDPSWLPRPCGLPGNSLSWSPFFSLLPFSLLLLLKLSSPEAGIVSARAGVSRLCIRLAAAE
ncbi:hypothetical protein NDU88_003004 [Pleurodeles waltl]|uniref:Uncharacterized protein n=1 Tax=Pleurodeles waltl TaxID=8319 RepID=A0AAV7Q8J5_PLEWA|nr:hypothetical protein NDU88_003004 [Pleurodeles waltl]